MFGFGKKVAALKGSSKRIENRDLMQACVWGSTMVAAKDGTIDDSETRALDGLLRNSDKIGHFGSELTDTLNKARSTFDVSFRAGKLQAMREIGDVKGNRNDAEDVLVTIITVAEQGGIDDAEMSILREVASALGLRLEDYL